jgi:hypothetical protein
MTTREEALIRKREKAAERKRNQRAREAELAKQQVVVSLEPVERIRADELCHVRALRGDPYSLDEYLSTLIARDWDRWQVEKKALAEKGPCPKCGAELPQGCDDLFKGDSRCFRTYDLMELKL